MDLERLWAPWRLGYVRGERDERPAPPLERFLPGSEPTCFLCRAVADDDDRANLVVARRENVLVILNRYPYNNGHLLVSPQAHLGQLFELRDGVHVELIRTLDMLCEIFRTKMNAEGFNIGLNLGRAAGAGVPTHLHWHLVPRWSGDQNFMPVLAGTRVLPQSLDELWQFLSEEMKQYAP